VFKGFSRRRKLAARTLTEGERALVREVFGDAIDLDRARIHARAFVPLAHRRGLAIAPNGHVYFHPDDHRDDFSRAGLAQQAWFIHEMTHVWQHQCGTCVWLRGLLNRRYGYLPFDPRRPFSSYGVEQQGDIVQDYFTLLRGGRVPGAPPLDAYRALLPFVPAPAAVPARARMSRIGPHPRVVGDAGDSSGSRVAAHPCAVRGADDSNGSRITAHPCAVRDVDASSGSRITAHPCAVRDADDSKGSRVTAHPCAVRDADILSAVAAEAGSVAASTNGTGGASTMAEKKAEGGMTTLLRDVRATLGDLFTGGRLDPGQEVNVEVLFGMMGFLARADSIVTSHEAEFVNALMDELELPTRGRELAMQSFDRGRKREIDLDAEMQRFLVAHPKGTPELNHLYDSLLRLAGADGRLRPGERVFLEKITAGLGFSVSALEARLANLSPK
jgi:DnaJ like chaperone protein